MKTVSFNVLFPARVNLRVEKEKPNWDWSVDLTSIDLHLDIVGNLDFWAEIEMLSLNED